MRKDKEIHKGYVIKYGNRYLRVDPTGMGGFSHEFVNLNLASVFSSADARYHFDTTPVVDEKKNYEKVTGTILKVQRTVQKVTDTIIIKERRQ